MTELQAMEVIDPIRALIMDDIKTALRFWIVHRASPLTLAQLAQGPCITLLLVPEI